MLNKYTLFAKLATLQATRMFSACPAKVTNPAPPFFLSLQKQHSMWLPPLATQAPTSHIFVLLPFQRPPAPVAEASTSLPLLAAQADQALQPFPPNITNHVACSRSKREVASACNTGPHMLFTLLLLTPFFFFSGL